MHQASLIEGGCLDGDVQFEYAASFNDDQFRGNTTMDTEFMLKGVPQGTSLELIITPVLLVPLPGLTGPTMSSSFNISKCS